MGFHANLIPIMPNLREIDESITSVACSWLPVLHKCTQISLTEAEEEEEKTLSQMSTSPDGQK